MQSQELPAETPAPRFPIESRYSTVGCTQRLRHGIASKRHLRLPITCILSLLLPVSLLFFFQGCVLKETADDTQKLAALRKVAIQYDSLTFEVGLPPGALSGQSFSELRSQNPEAYENLANYSITQSLHNTADNTSSDARDAKFDGMRTEAIMDNITDESLDLETPGFEVDAGTTVAVTSSGTLNLQTHKKAGRYIFQQMADGLDLSITLVPFLLYDIAGQSGEIELPRTQQDVPTRASPEMRRFLGELLESGLLDG